MPELPEVETIRRGLEKYLVGHVIEDVEIRLAKQFSGNPKLIIGTKIISVRRFGKGLVIDLENLYSAAIHIKMTGQLIYQGPDIPKGSKPSVAKVGTALPSRHTHIIFRLDKKATLFYNDIRQFGWIKIVKTDEVGSLPFFKELGPEPLKDLDFAGFKNIIAKIGAPIKSVLMDQKKIGGIGNIYANDALYLAKINPKRPASSLTAGELRELFNAIENVLKKGLEVGGASEWQYVNALGEAGGYQNFFQVYGRDGKLCKRCKSTIERIKIGGRGTFYCPGCQS